MTPKREEKISKREALDALREIIETSQKAALALGDLAEQCSMIEQRVRSSPGESLSSELIEAIADAMDSVKRMVDSL